MHEELAVLFTLLSSASLGSLGSKITLETITILQPLSHKSDLVC